METRTPIKQAEDLLKTMIDTCQAQLRSLENHNIIDYTPIQLLAGKIAAISDGVNNYKSKG